MKAELKAALVLFSVVFVVIQVLPGVGRVNPPVRPVSTPPPPEVQQVLKRACFDCHSNETEWPAASRIAPIGWAVESQVYAARAKMNLSLWPDDPDGQAVARKKIGQMVAAGKMPLVSYRLASTKGRLTEEEVTLLKTWADAPTETSPIKDAAIHGGTGATLR